MIKMAKKDDEEEFLEAILEELVEIQITLEDIRKAVNEKFEGDKEWKGK